MKRLRVLSISTLFPSPARPAFGKFVAEQMRAVTARDDIDLTVLNPVGLPPWPLSRAAPYRAQAATPESSAFHGLTARHPRFTLIPGWDAQRNPRRIAHALLPMARALHEAQPFDLVDAQFFFPDGPAAATIAHALDRPLTIKARGSDIHHWGTVEGARARMLAAASQAAGLLAVSGALRRDMAALGMPEDRIAVHYTGLDHDRFRPMGRGTARARVCALPGLGALADEPLLVAPGALIPLKGQALAIAALAHLPPTARLALAGTGGDEARLRDIARSMGVADRVHFLGHVSHEYLPHLLNAADAIVLPSEREGLANAWIEALACGTPVVIPDIGGAREVVLSPSAGRIVERTPEAIAAAVAEILSDPPEQSEVAANVERFSWTRNADELAAFWREAAAG